MRNAVRLALAFLAAPSALVAQEPAIFEVDLKPTTRSFDRLLFEARGTRTFDPWSAFADDSAWLELEDRSEGERAPGGALSAPPSSEVGPKERWLMSTVKSRFKGVTTAETVERSTIRHDGANRNVARQRGIEAKGSREAVASVREFFDRFKAGSKQVVILEVKVFEAGGEAGPPRYPKSVAAATTRAEYERRARELSTRGANSLMSPTIKVYANQTAQASMGERVSYIKDWELQILPGGREIADPVLDVVTDGFHLELTPIYDPDGKALIVGGSVKLSHLERPIREHRAKIGEGDVTIQLPSVITNSWNGEVKLEQGQDTFVITGMRQHLGGREARSVEVWCLVTLEDGATGGLTGEIVDRDEKNGNVFVSFPREAVPDDPWNKAPKEVDVYRRGEKIGTARLAGGWVLPSNPTHPVIAIYQLAEGAPRDGDSVKLASTR